MKTTLLTLALVAASSSALASAPNYDFVAVDNSERTQLCVVSAKEGLNAAKKFAKGRNITDTKCNGQNIADFAKQFQAVSDNNQPAVKYSVVASDNNAASVSCAKAASEGLKSLNLSSEQLSTISCNGINIEKFASTYFSL